MFQQFSFEIQKTRPRVNAPFFHAQLYPRLTSFLQFFFFHHPFPSFCFYMFILWRPQNVHGYLPKDAKNEAGGNVLSLNDLKSFLWEKNPRSTRRKANIVLCSQNLWENIFSSKISVWPFLASIISEFNLVNCAQFFDRFRNRVYIKWIKYNLQGRNR